MNRLLVALLAAFDAVVAAAIGVAAVLAPLTVLWAFGFEGTARWSGLWPTAVRVWQTGHLVPMQLTLPPEYVAATGIVEDAVSFAFSLAPLAFAAFTAVFAARSGARAARSGAWPTGVLAGTATFALLAAAMTATSRNAVAGVAAWQAILLPAAVFGLAALGGAAVTAWRDGDDGPIDRLRARWGADPRWRDVPAAVARGTGVALAGLVGLGALLVVVGLVVRGGEVIALFEAAHVDVLGASMLTLGQLAYLPTLVVWAASFVAGPGFVIGAGTSVSPAATQLGVVPGVPILGIVPESGSPWLLLLALLVVGAGVAAGWAARARMLRSSNGAEPAGPRAVTTIAIALLSGLGAAVLGWAASGAIGPGRLQSVGPDVVPFAVAVALEVAVGAGILLLSPRGSTRHAGDDAWVDDDSGRGSAGGARPPRADVGDAGSSTGARVGDSSLRPDTTLLGGAGSPTDPRP